MQKEPDAHPATIAFIESAAKGDIRLVNALNEIKDMLADRATLERRSRALAERLALLLAGTLLLAHAPTAIAEPFISSRLAGGWRQTYGAGLRDADHNAILARAGDTL
jgi:putative acyl-CoA dehydrogenase